MAFEQKIAALFRLNEETWMKHANPWSVWTRYSVLPVIVLAAWSRLWIGWWYLLPLGISILWMFANPLLFPKPTSTNNWASKAVLGERVYLNRETIPIPTHHKRAPIILNIIAGIGMLLAIWAMVTLQLWPAILGVALAYLGKSWFLDRMVWLYEDMKHHAQYSQWLYEKKSASGKRK